jgi:hypothetical protein
METRPKRNWKRRDEQRRVIEMTKCRGEGVRQENEDVKSGGGKRRGKQKFESNMNFDSRASGGNTNIHGKSK